MIEQCHKNQISQFLAQVPCFGLYFDGKRDKTNVYVRNEGTNRNHLRQQVEEHISIVFEPNHLFYTHVTPENGTAECIAECIWQQLKWMISLPKNYFLLVPMERMSILVLKTVKTTHLS